MGKHDHGDAVDLKHIRPSEACLAICAHKHCARGGAKQVIKAAHAALDEAGLAERVQVRLTTCQDYCDDGPAMTVMPGSYPYQELDPPAVRRVVFEHLRDGRPVFEHLPKRVRRKLERRLGLVAATSEDE